MVLSQATIWVDDRGTDKQVWFAFETDHKNLHELNADLVANGTVAGWRIDTAPMGQGLRRVVRRYEFIIAKDAVVTISAPQFELAEPEAARA